MEGKGEGWGVGRERERDLEGGGREGERFGDGDLSRKREVKYTNIFIIIYCCVYAHMHTPMDWLLAKVYSNLTFVH